MKIPIKKHTKVRRPPSIWPIDLTGTKLWDSYLYERDDKIQDISKGLENPLDLVDLKFIDDWKYDFETVYTTEKEIVKHQKGDWNEWHKDMEEGLPRHYEPYQKVHKTKNSLLKRSLTRIKRIGRKK